MIRRARLALPLLVAAALLTGCGGGPAPEPTASASETPTATPTATPSASASEAPAPTTTIPTDCAALGTPATHAETVGDMTLQSDGVGFVRPAPDGAVLALGCDWIVGDATGVLVLISTADPSAVTAAVPTLAGQGYTCQFADDFGADFCTAPGDGPDTEQMIVARDDVWIYLSSANVNARALLSDIATQVFG